MNKTHNLPVWFQINKWSSEIEVLTFEPSPWVPGMHFGPYIVAIPIPQAVTDAYEAMIIEPTNVRRAKASERQ